MENNKFPKNFSQNMNFNKMFYFNIVLCWAGVVNRGDSFRRRRSRSNSLAPAEQENEVRRSPPTEVASHNVAMLGTRGVGKTALISQFMTSECINAYDRQRGKFRNNNFISYSEHDKAMKKV
jgi:Cdc6-like AAA superfamily ATPase